MVGDLPVPQAGKPEQTGAQEADSSAKPQVVDWFALTEDNLQPTAAEPAPTEAPTLEVPTACAVGGLRP